MKIGVITHWWCFENYGELLQCYAFQRFLIKNGHEPFLVKWYPGAGFADSFTHTRLALRIAKKLLHPIAAFESVLKRLKPSERRAERRRASILPQRDFDDFREHYLKFAPGVYRSFDEMLNRPELAADMYSVGSDVVWKYFPLDDNGRIPFLDFVSSGVPRISYSPSFGSAIVSDDVKAYIAPLLKKFDAVSVREQSGVFLCREMGRDDAVCVLDPVFLMERADYMTAFDIPNERNGVFSYLLKMKVKYPLVEALALSPNEPFAVTTVYDDQGIDARYLTNPTIPQWVRNLGSAKFVVTNSFHGTSMCIILHTPFAVMLRKEGEGMDNRLTTILERVGLSGRIYRTEGDLARLRDKPIDWEEVDRRLAAEKAVSIDYLRRVRIVE